MGAGADALEEGEDDALEGDDEVFLASRPDGEAGVYSFFFLLFFAFFSSTPCSSKSASRCFRQKISLLKVDLVQPSMVHFSAGVP